MFIVVVVVVAIFSKIYRYVVKEE